MGHIYYKLWNHLVWSTKNRFPYLNYELQKKLHSHILINAKKKGIFIEAIDGYTDHLHILLHAQPKDQISEIVRLIKGESAHWINSEKLLIGRFAWQDGYSVFSVSESQCEKVRNYIAKQKEHHKKISFLEEVNKLLELHKIQAQFKEG